MNPLQTDTAFKGIYLSTWQNILYRGLQLFLWQNKSASIGTETRKYVFMTSTVELSNTHQLKADMHQYASDSVVLLETLYVSSLRRSDLTTPSELDKEDNWFSLQLCTISLP